MFCPCSPGFLTRCLPVSQLLRPSTQAEQGPCGMLAAAREALPRCPCERGASCSPARVFRDQEVIEGMFGGSGMVGTSRRHLPGSGTQCPLVSDLEKAKDRPW